MHTRTHGGATNSTIVCAKARAELTSVAAEKLIQHAEFDAASEGRGRHEALGAPSSQLHMSSPISREHAGGAVPGSIPCPCDGVVARTMGGGGVVRFWSSYLT